MHEEATKLRGRSGIMLSKNTMALCNIFGFKGISAYIAHVNIHMDS
jgi:hypothetical protein